MLKMLRPVSLELIEGQLLDEGDEIVLLDDVSVVVQDQASTAWIEPDLPDAWLVSQQGLEGLCKVVENLRELDTHAETAPDRMNQAILARGW